MSSENKLPFESQTTMSGKAATFWVYVQNWAARCITLVVFFILARLLSPEEFGIFTVALIFVTVGEIFIEQILAHSIIQREKLTQIHLNSAFWAVVVFSVVLAIGVIFIAPLYARLSGSPNAAPVIMALTPIFLFMGMSGIFAALLRRRLDYKTLTRRTILANIISGVVAVAAAFSGLGLWTFVIQLLVFNLVGLVVLWRYESWRPEATFSFTALKELLGFSARITFVKILDLIETRGVELVIARNLGVVVLGNYSLASKTQQTVNQLLASPLGESAISIFSRLQSDREAFLKSVFIRQEIAVALVAPIFVLIAVTADWLIPLVFGDKWMGAVVAFKLLCLLAGVRVVVYIYEAVLKALGAANAVIVMTVIRIFGWLVFLPFLMKSFSIAGVATALLIGQIISIPVGMKFVKDRLDIKMSTMFFVFIKPFLTIVFAVFIGYLSSLLLTGYLSSFTLFILTLLIGIVTFCISLILIMPKFILVCFYAVPTSFQKHLTPLFHVLMKIKGSPKPMP